MPARGEVIHHPEGPDFEVVDADPRRIKRMRVRLIATAADEPERLYLEGEGSFEFERTASRLREMQAADWGQR